MVALLMTMGFAFSATEGIDPVILSQVSKNLILDNHVGPTLRRSSFFKIILDQPRDDLQDPPQAWRASSWSRGRFPRRRSPCSQFQWSLSRSSSPSSSPGDSLSFYLSIIPHQATHFKFFKFFQDSKFTKQSSLDRQFTQLMKFILKSSTNNEISDRRFTVGPRPMNVFLISYPARLILCLLLVLLVFVTPMWVENNEKGEILVTKSD